MSDAAVLYKSTSMMSEEPSIDWLLRGLRGLRVFLAQAVAGIETGNIDAKITAVTRVSELLSFMQGITQSQGEQSLGASLANLYTSFHVQLTKAHAENDAKGLREISDQIGQLERELSNISALA